MMKRLFQALVMCVAFAGFPAHAATYYVKDCTGVGKNAGCTTSGSDANTAVQAQSQTTPWQTCAKVAAVFPTLAAGDSVLFSVGGAWDNCAIYNVNNTNSTAASPVTLGKYDPGGQGTANPILNSAGTGAAALYFNGGTRSVGLIVQDLNIVGPGVAAAQGAGIWILYDYDSITLRRLDISGFSGGIQCGGGNVNITPVGLVNGQPDQFVLQNSAIHDNYGSGLLSACAGSLVENNTFTGNGLGQLDHQIYLDDLSINNAAFDGHQFILRGNTLAENGSYAYNSAVTISVASPAVVTWSGHPFVANDGVTLITNGTLPTGLTAYTQYYVKTVVDANNFTVSLTPGGVAINTTVANTGSRQAAATTRRTGLCGSVAMVIHGKKYGIDIEGNKWTETAPSAGGCWALGINAGYSDAVYGNEGFYNVIIRGNTMLNQTMGMALDIAQNVTIENNYVQVASSSTVCGIMSRWDPSVPLATLGYLHNDPNPDKITVRYNTVYNSAPNSSAAGICLTGYAGDAQGTHHNIYGNSVSFATGTGVGNSCFDTTNVSYTLFDSIDYNSCYYAGTAGKWDRSHGAGDLTANTALGLDTHSIATNPQLSTPATSPAIPIGSPLVNAGVPTICPAAAWGGVKRNQGVCDIGAYEYGASTVLPGGVSNITVNGKP